MTSERKAKSRIRNANPSTKANTNHTTDFM
jgi:hypothetical protein